MEKAALERITERVMSDVFNTGKLAVIDEVGADDLCVHFPQAAAPLCGRAAVTRAFSRVRAAFPDAHFLIEERMVSTDRVVLRWTGRATHTGAFWGLPPTGTQVTWSGILLFHFSAGKIAEIWLVADALNLYQQLEGTWPPNY